MWLLHSREGIEMLTCSLVGAILVVALAVAMLRAVREQLHAERPPRTRPLETPPPPPEDDPAPRPLAR
jgi:cell division septation protein DedD